MTSLGWTVRGTVALAVLALLAVGFAGVGSAQSTAATDIDSCTTVDEPGRYVLTDDVTNDSADTCLDIRADNVTLDGNGSVVAGNGTEASVGVGIEAGASNVTVGNVTTTNWSQGVRVANATGVTATNVTARNNGDGVVYANVSRTMLTDSTASANDADGVVVNESETVLLARNNVTDNGDDGIDIGESDGVVATANTLGGNGDLPVAVTNSTNIRIQSTNGTVETPTDPETPKGGPETSPTDEATNGPV